MKIECSMCKGVNDRPGQRHCAACHKAYMTEWRRERAVELNPVVEAVKRDRRIEKKYRVSPDDLEAMLAKQDSACAICITPFGDLPVDRYNVDHDHNTGHVRGLLCQRCNQALGMMEDDPVKLDRAAQYLRLRAVTPILASKPIVTMAAILARLGRPTAEAAE